MLDIKRIRKYLNDSRPSPWIPRGYPITEKDFKKLKELSRINPESFERIFEESRTRSSDSFLVEFLCKKCRKRVTTFQLTKKQFILHLTMSRNWVKQETLCFECRGK